jgi:peptidoglycan/LPS O-acetylase OafA/YrhL
MTNGSSDDDSNPFSPPTPSVSHTASTPKPYPDSGPLPYFSAAMLVGFLLAVPLIVPRSLAVKDDPNPVGYALILLSFPVGGLIYRIRSRNWPIDKTVRRRQIAACFATLLVPPATAFFLGSLGQGPTMAALGGIVSLSLISGILLSGLRRGSQESELPS